MFIGAWEEGRLIRGQRYRVQRSFVDFDGDAHLVGEEWIFLASMFSPMDDLLLIVVQQGLEEWRILLHWTPDTQEHVIENYTDYVVRVMAGRSEP